MGTPVYEIFLSDTHADIILAAQGFSDLGIGCFPIFDTQECTQFLSGCKPSNLVFVKYKLLTKGNYGNKYSMAAVYSIPKFYVTA